MKNWLGTIFGVFLSVSLASGEDWPCWRGPRGDGQSSETNLPIKWSPTENIAWKTPIPGIGHSSPIVHGDHVFLTTCLLKEQVRLLICLNRKDGSVRWQKEVVQSPLEPKHSLNSYASSTPATDGKLVYISFLRLRPKSTQDGPPSLPREKSPVPTNLVPEMVVSAYDFKGNLAWEKVPGRFYSRHGFSASPLLYKDKVIVNGDQDAEAFIVALDKSTGEERYRIPRDKRFRSYCVPLLFGSAGKMQMILTGAEHVHSYDPDSGKMHWMIDGPTEQYVASPVTTQGLVFLTAGFPTYHNMAIRPDGTGNVTKSHIVWHENKVSAQKAAYVPSPLAYGDEYYVVSDQGYLSTLDAKSGKRHYFEKVANHTSGSPIVAEGRIYFTDDDGITYVIKAGSTYELIAENRLGDRCFTSPAVSQGQIFVRTAGYLWCIGKN